MIDTIISTYSLHGNWIDLLFILVIIYFVITNEGLVPTSFDLVGLFFSFIFSFKFYPFFAKIFIANFSFSQGIANAIGFFSAWVLSEVLFFILAKYIYRKIPPRLFRNTTLNKALGGVPAVMQGSILFAFILTLVFTLPVRGDIKNSVLNSRTGRPIMGISQRLESRLQNIFNSAVVETLNFLTIKENSEKKIDLGFKVVKENLKKDTVSEIAMLNLVNRERQSRGLAALQFDEALRKVSQEYAQEMFVHGFFSHYSAVDGSSPADRIERNNINYKVTGENLAFAPDVQIAHNGLMNSKGHRENILSPEYKRVGIGVADAGIFGKIFVQEFTN